MHLTLHNCFSKNPLQCLMEWCFTTTTSFYGYDEDELHLPVLFGVFCWNYSVGGLVMLYTKPTWVKRSQFPYTLFCVLLILIQAPLSFLADYCHMTADSTWHVYDRLAACISMALQVWKIVELWKHHDNIPFLIWYSLLLVLAVICFGQSQAAQRSQDPEQFVLWHNLWHL